MHLSVTSCPSCSQMWALHLGSFPYSHMQHGEKVVTVCPHCGDKVQIGFVKDFERVENPTNQSAEEGPGPSGGGGGMAPVRAAPSPNDQRSNAMNPNNPASRAAESNRANQLNPNNPAYRSSGGRR